MITELQQDPVLKAGTTPLPYVQVGMVLRPLPAMPANASWRVTHIYSTSPLSLCSIVRLLEMRSQCTIMELSAATVGSRWELAEDFDPNGARS